MPWDPRKNKAAIIWQGEGEDEVRTFTYQQLLHEVSKFANVLKSKGVQKGDRVSIYMPMIPELVFAMLACARIGAVHSVVFGGFSSESLRDRINDSDCKVLITADGNHRGGKLVTLKQNADVALERGTTIKSVIVVKRAGNECVMEEGRDFWYHEEMAKASPQCDPVWMDAEDPLFILYTSGSTGKPKGVLHTTGGYMVFTTIDHQVHLRPRATRTSTGAPPTAAGSPGTATSPTDLCPMGPPRSSSRAYPPTRRWTGSGRWWRSSRSTSSTPRPPPSAR